ncbi:MAG TPA: PDZ domain-containing protein [Gemmatimonadaceae bacterium]|nr:PDZ domain-containing protein [Gemmatimonadaceae bacterium]
MRISTILTATLAVGLAAGVAHSQRERTQVTRAWGGDEDRAVLGVSTSTTGKRDTLGLLVTGVTSGGPAEKAGIEEGNRIASINGTNLRLSKEDAGESDMMGIASRRLTRELGKVKPGDEVELRVWADGKYKTVKVKTSSREDLPGARRASREEMDDRAVVGLGLEGTGSRRDSLGILVTRVAEGGPAEKAGIVEGDRIAAINGVSLRVAPEDAGDEMIAGAKASRFSRELRRLEPGADVELRVWSGGQYKTVRVKAAKASDVYKNEGRGFRVFVGDRVGVAPMPPMPPVPPMPPMRMRAPEAGTIVIPRMDFQFDGAEIDMRGIERAMERAQEAMERARFRMEGQLQQLDGRREELRARRASYPRTI